MRRTLIVLCMIAGMCRSVAGEELVRDEQRIYVPYSKLTEIFGEESRAVIMPYEDFLKLWQAIPDKPEPEPTPAPPVEAALTSARYAGTLAGEIATFKAELTIRTLIKGWARVKLGFQNVYITSASLNTGELVITHAPDGYEILLTGPGDYILSVQFAVKVEELGADYLLGFILPESPVSEITLQIQGKAVGVSTDPQLAVESTVQGTATTITITNGAVNQFTLAWQTETVRRGERSAMAYVTTVHKAKATADFQRVSSRFHYEVKGESLQTVTIAVPANARVLDVTGSGLETWKLETEAKTTVLRVDLQEPKRDFAFETELESSISADGALAPIPFCQEVRRERGYVLLYKTPGLQLVATPGEGVYMAALDAVPSFLPQDKTEVEQAFYYLNSPVTMTLAVTRKQPRIDAVIIHSIGIKEEVLEATYACTLHVRNAPVFSTELNLPKQLELIEVQPATVVSDYRVQEREAGALLEIVFAEPITSTVTFTLTCRMSKLLEAASLAIPLVTTTKADHETGTVVIDAIEKFKLQTLEQKNLLPVSLEAVRNEGLIAEDYGLIAYRYGRTPMNLVIGIETRASRVTADVALNLNVEQDLLRVNAQVKFTVLYAGIDKVRLKIPEAVAANVEIEGPQIKEKAIKDRQEGQTYWEIQFQDTFTGERIIVVSYYQKIKEDKGAATIAPEIIEVLDVAREVGYVSITKGANIEVTAAVEELEAYDSADLPPEFSQSGIILCWKYLKHPFALNLTVTRHDYEDLVNTIVQTMNLTTVVSRERTAVNHLRMVVHNKGRQYIALKLPEKTKVYELLVNNEEVRPSLRPSDGMTLIPLASAVANEAIITIELLYEYQLGSQMKLIGRLSLQVPEPHLIPVQKTYQDLYLPYKFRYFPPGGTMQPFDHRYDVMTTSDLNQYPQTGQVQPAKSMETQLATLLVKEGRHYRFIKLHGPGTITFFFMGRKSFLLFRLLLLLLPLLSAGYLYQRYGLALSTFALYLGSAVLVAIIFSEGFYQRLWLWPGFAALILALFHSRHAIKRLFASRPRPTLVYVPPPGVESSESVSDTTAQASDSEAHDAEPSAEDPPSSSGA